MVIMDICGNWLKQALSIKTTYVTWILGTKVLGPLHTTKVCRCHPLPPPDYTPAYTCGMTCIIIVGLHSLYRGSSK